MTILDQFFWLPPVAFAAFFLFRLIKYGGFRGMLYGSTVLRTVGEVELTRTFGLTTSLRVLVLENGKVVLEYSGGSNRGIPLSADHTEKLISLLQQART